MALQKLRNIDLSDRRTQLIVGGALAVVIIAVILLLVLRKPAGGARPPVPMMGMMGMMGGNMPGGGNAPAGGNMPAGGAPMGGMPGMGPMGMMGMGAGATMGAGGMTGQGEAPKPTRKVPAGPPKEPSRADPFSVPIPKEVFERISRVDIVPPPRLTPQTAPMPTTAIVQVPFTRMAGIAIANGVYALLERTNGQMIIVSPGDTVDGLTVERIEADKVVLKGEGGEETVVEMKGATAGAGMPGMGGMMPGAGMVPGMGVMPGMMPRGGMMPGAGMPGMGGMPGMPGQGQGFRGQ